MPDWQERITRDTAPVLRAEHGLRYRLAAPLVADAAVWCDLGSGNGVAAADAFGGSFSGQALLVDVASDAVEAAAGELRAAGITDVAPLSADLTDSEALGRIRGSLLETPGERVVTCFEVVEHLSTFVPLIQLLSELAEAGEATVLLSVPNDAFFATENPHHLSSWGAGAFDELRRLLPPGAQVFHQVALSGSAIVPADGTGTVSPSVALQGADAVPTHFLAIMGPAVERVADVDAEVVQTDLDGQRTWEREREANLAYDESVVVSYKAWFDEWSPYLPALEKMRERRAQKHRLGARLRPITRRLGPPRS
jgi:hypothetical protein